MPGNSKPHVFVNRTLNLKKTQYVGFDMDHTLVRYKNENFEGLAYRATLEKLVTECGYPESIKKLQFDPERSIRGLVVDKKHGNILKLNRFAAIRMSFHGTKRIDFQTQKTFYRSTYIDLGDPSYSAIDTLFSTAYAVLYAQLVDFKDGPKGKGIPDYYTLADDLSRTIDVAHSDGTLKDEVRANLEHYVIIEPSMVERLEEFVHHDKKLFVLTNSEFAYTKLLLDHTINPFLKRHKHWTELFEFVITKAQKPRFFTDKLDFLKINPETGTMENVIGTLEPGVYQGGCAQKFTDELGVAGDDILYIGDHIYSDIVRLKKDCNWRTALVVEELLPEIENLEEVHELDEKIARLMEEKEPFEAELLEITTKARNENKRTADERSQELQSHISGIDKRISSLIQKRDARFNPYWGEFMRIGNEESYFARQVENYACIYMPTISDFLNCSPRSYFRARRRTLPHEA